MYDPWINYNNEIKLGNSYNRINLFVAHDMNILVFSTFAHEHHFFSYHLKSSLFQDGIKVNFKTHMLTLKTVQWLEWEGQLLT